MKDRVPLDFRWLPPWECAQAAGAALERELHAEISDGHPLYLLRTTPIARRTDCDDVLVATDDDSRPFALVHLTWRGSPEPDPSFPVVTSSTTSTKPSLAASVCLCDDVPVRPEPACPTYDLASTTFTAPDQSHS